MGTKPLGQSLSTGSLTFGALEAMSGPRLREGDFLMGRLRETQPQPASYGSGQVTPGFTFACVFLGSSCWGWALAQGPGPSPVLLPPWFHLVFPPLFTSPARRRPCSARPPGCSLGQRSQTLPPRRETTLH